MRSHMLKKIVLTLGTLCWLLPAAHAQQGAIGTVALQKVMQESEEGKKIRKELEKFVEEKSKDIKKKQEAVEKMRKDYEKQAAVLNDKARIEKETKIQQEMMTLEDLRRKYQEEFEKLEKEKRDPMLEKLFKIVEEISKKSEVMITFDKASAPILYYGNEKDLTKEVLDAYNKKYPMK